MSIDRNATPPPAPVAQADGGRDVTWSDVDAQLANAAAGQHPAFIEVLPTQAAALLYLLHESKERSARLAEFAEADAIGRRLERMGHL